MTTMTDLTKERLDEIEAFHWGEIDCMPEKTDAEMRALVAMAKRAEAAERERDALRALLEEIDVADVGVRTDVYPADGSILTVVCRDCDAVLWRHAIDTPPGEHKSDCLWLRIDLALAQPTDAGGA